MPELDDWLALGCRLAPFAPEAENLCTRLSQRLFAHALARIDPGLAAFAFWLRPARLAEMRRNFLSGCPESCLSVPRGVVLHFPPANVDSLFAYGWALALLAGNRSIIRVPERLGTMGRLLLALIGETLADSSADLAASTLFLTHPRDDGLTAALSARADVRVLWGGDASAAWLRGIPAPPRGRDVIFPDRQSLAAVSLPAYAAADEAARTALAEGMVNDALLFDQMACSSPRLLAWVGDGDMAAARDEFFGRMQTEAARRGTLPPLAQQMAKRTQAAGWALDGETSMIRQWGPAVTVVYWPDAAKPAGAHVGGGMFLETHLAALEDLIPACTARTQTLTAFGFSNDALRAFAAAAGSRAPDRIVPVGQALAFSPYWDGLDLLREFTRLVHLPRP
jgi:hypothetical protein